MLFAFNTRECDNCVKSGCTYCVGDNESVCECGDFCSDFKSEPLETKWDCSFETSDGEAALATVILIPVLLLGCCICCCVACLMYFRKNVATQQQQQPQVSSMTTTNMNFSGTTTTVTTTGNASQVASPAILNTCSQIGGGIIECLRAARLYGPTWCPRLRDYHKSGHQ